MTPADRMSSAGFSTQSLQRAAPANPAAYYPQALLSVAFASAASITFSIAVSQILLGLGLLLLAFGRARVEFPPVKLLLALFFAATVLADLLSGHALSGIPQLKKLFVFGIIPLVYTALRTASQIRNLLVVWTGIAVLSASAGFFQVIARHREAIRLKWNTYDYYLDDRIKGFASHWMTFGAEQMIVLLMLISFLLFVCPRRWRLAGWCAAAVLWTSLLLGLTRSIFLLGVPTGILYLLWSFRPWTLWLIPVLAILSYIAVPFQVRERVRSVITPHGELDSNAQRSVTRRAGFEMIKAHPWFGIGPEQIKPQFEAWVPADVPRPLPHGWYGHLHNIYLQFAAERGVPALIFLLWLIGKMVADFTRALRLRTASADAQFVFRGAVAVTMAVLAEGFFEYNLGDSEVLTMFLVVTTSAYVVIRAERQLCG